jgi:hypothetical protein
MFFYASVKSQEYSLRSFPNFYLLAIYPISDFNGKIDPRPINQLIAPCSLVG